MVEITFTTVTISIMLYLQLRVVFDQVVHELLVEQLHLLTVGPGRLCLETVEADSSVEAL